MAAPPPGPLDLGGDVARSSLQCTSDAGCCVALLPAEANPAAACACTGGCFAGGRWNFIKGVPGNSYSMYTDGKGTKLSTTFAAGGYSGKATFIRAVQLTRGSLGASATLVKVNNRWVLKGE